ncbi:hypothetical protein C8F04DRAFT_1193742 [Mycena alexandri]|uniref:Uncharacterized protein n=1 Tax=Mycena alexandri TaxID=1745969 RepID=A0AAD6SAE8_9AGAR|nr:hypothetical protein C8F04DRAFT_1193742 [Mycena alexandri]
MQDEAEEARAILDKLWAKAKELKAEIRDEQQAERLLMMLNNTHATIWGKIRGTNKVDTSWGYKKCLTRPFLAGGPHYGDSTAPRGTQRGTGLLFRTYRWWEGDNGGTRGTPRSFGVQVIGVDGAWGTQGLFGVQAIDVGGAGGTQGSFGVQVSGVDGGWGTPGTFGVQVSALDGTGGTPRSFGVQVVGVDGAWGTQGLFGVQAIDVGGAGGTQGSFGVQVSGVDGGWGTPGTFGVQVSALDGTGGTPRSFGVQMVGVDGVQGTPSSFSGTGSSEGYTAVPWCTHRWFGWWDRVGGGTGATFQPYA